MRMIFQESETIELKEIVTDDIKKEMLGIFLILMLKRIV